nr:thermonuclease family protein [Nitrospirota bacterium]
MIPRTLRLTLPPVLVLCLFPALTIAHPGGLDAYGCHKNRKAGIYECHRGEFAGRSFASQAEMLAGKQGSYTAVPPTLPARQFSGKVVAVSDGDTISVMHEGKAEDVRLNGIDCPEKDQAFGGQATTFTTRLVFGKEVTVTSHGPDKYGRTIGDVSLLDGTTRARCLRGSGGNSPERRCSEQGGGV